MGSLPAMFLRRLPLEVQSPVCANGDMIRFDVRGRVLEVKISDEVLPANEGVEIAAATRFPTGMFAKYAALVSLASRGQSQKHRDDHRDRESPGFASRDRDIV